MGIDQRADPRFDAIIPVRFRDAEDFLVQYSQNISAGGIFIRTDTPPPKGTQLRLSLELPESRTAIPCEGKVAFVLTPRLAAGPHQEPGVGVRFTQMDPAARRTLLEFVEMLELRSRGSVLVVDDEEEVVRFLTDLLRRNRFNVLCAEDGQQALRVLEVNHVDVVLSDINMPRMDGLELRRRLLQTAWKNLPFVLLTASEDRSHREEAEKLGVGAFLEKPVSTRDLVEVISIAMVGLAPVLDAERPRVQHLRKQAEIAGRKMSELGIECAVDGGAGSVRGRIALDRSRMRHALTGKPISFAEVRNRGHDRIAFVGPPHLANLSPMLIADLPDNAALQDRIVAAYKSRCDWIELGQAVLQQLRIPQELYEGGFCVLGCVSIDEQPVLLSVRDRATLVVESVSGKLLPRLINPSECILDIAVSSSREDVQQAIRAILHKHERVLSLVPEAEAPAIRVEQPEPTSSADVFQQLDDALGIPLPGLRDEPLWLDDVPDGLAGVVRSSKLAPTE